MATKANINEVDHLADKVLELNMFVVDFEVNWIKNLSSNRLTLLQQYMYAPSK
jgi:hypothetical protein